MMRVRFSGLAVAMGVATLSAVLFATSALAAGGTGTGMGSGGAGTGMGSGGTGSHMTTPSGGTVTGDSSSSTGSGSAGSQTSTPSGSTVTSGPVAVMGSGSAGSPMSAPSGAVNAGGPSPSAGPMTAAGNVAPQAPGPVMGGAGAAVGQGSGYPVNPSFMMGFGTMASIMGSVAGQPIEDEWHGMNGDGLQRTTTGLMVWRKADNWTAFTNGYMTWVNGPYGMQMRLNTERFPWEAQ